MATNTKNKSYKIALASYDFGDYLSHRGSKYSKAAKRFARAAKRGEKGVVKREIKAACDE